MPGPLRSNWFGGRAFRLGRCVVVAGATGVTGAHIVSRRACNRHGLQHSQIGRIELNGDGHQPLRRQLIHTAAHQPFNGLRGHRQLSQHQLLSQMQRQAFDGFVEFVRRVNDAAHRSVQLDHDGFTGQAGFILFGIPFFAHLATALLQAFVVSSLAFALQGFFSQRQSGGCSLFCRNFSVGQQIFIAQCVAGLGIQVAPLAGWRPGLDHLGSKGLLGRVRPGLAHKSAAAAVRLQKV